MILYRDYVRLHKMSKFLSSKKKMAQIVIEYFISKLKFLKKILLLPMLKLYQMLPIQLIYKLNLRSIKISRSASKLILKYNLVQSDILALVMNV